MTNALDAALFEIQPDDDVPWWARLPEHKRILAPYRSALAAYDLGEVLTWWESEYDEGRCAITHDGACEWLDIPADQFAKYTGPRVAHGYMDDPLDSAAARPDVFGTGLLRSLDSEFHWPFRLVEYADDLVEDDGRPVDVDPRFASTHGITLVLTFCTAALETLIWVEEPALRRRFEDQEREREARRDRERQEKDAALERCVTRDDFAQWQARWALPENAFDLADPSSEWIFLEKWPEAEPVERPPAAEPANDVPLF